MPDPDDQIPAADNDPLAPAGGGLLKRHSQQDPPGEDLPQSGNPFTVDVESLDMDQFDVERVPEDLSGEDAEAVLNKLEAKMVEVTQSFTDGQLNQAQFQAMYTHYTEQRAVILRLLARNPDSDAWKRVAKEGHTTVLRRQHEGRLEGMAIYDNWSGTQIKTLGSFDLPDEILNSLLTNLNTNASTLDINHPQRTQIEGGRWLVYLRGDYVTCVSVYSAEPSVVQLVHLSRKTLEFEIANERLLENGIIDPRRLLFPQEAFFE